MLISGPPRALQAVGFTKKMNTKSKFFQWDARKELQTLEAKGASISHYSIIKTNYKLTDDLPWQCHCRIYLFSGGIVLITIFV